MKKIVVLLRFKFRRFTLTNLNAVVYALSTWKIRSEEFRVMENEKAARYRQKLCIRRGNIKSHFVSRFKNVKYGLTFLWNYEMQRNYVGK